MSAEFGPTHLLLSLYYVNYIVQLKLVVYGTDNGLSEYGSDFYSIILIRTVLINLMPTTINYKC